jgi:hypothetical protein
MTEPAPCRHPPARYFTWFAGDGTLCIACCDCGAVLRGASNPDEPLRETPKTLKQELTAYYRSPRRSRKEPTP